MEALNLKNSHKQPRSFGENPTFFCYFSGVIVFFRVAEDPWIYRCAIALSKRIHGSSGNFKVHLCHRILRTPVREVLVNAGGPAFREYASNAEALWPTTPSLQSTTVGGSIFLFFLSGVCCFCCCCRCWFYFCISNWLNWCIPRRWCDWLRASSRHEGRSQELAYWRQIEDRAWSRWCKILASNEATT